MDEFQSYPLVVFPQEHGGLVPVSQDLVVDLDSPDQAGPDLRAIVLFLWKRFCQLATLFWFVTVLWHRLRLQVIDLRTQANYWRAQHQRAVFMLRRVGPEQVVHVALRASVQR